MSAELEPRFAAISEAVGTHSPADLLAPLGQVVRLSLAELRGRSPIGKMPTRYRHVAMYLLRTHAKWSFPEIGLYFDRRDHSTIIHGCSRVVALKQRDASFARFVEHLEEIAAKGTVTAVPPALRRNAALAAPTRGIITEMRELRSDVASLREEIVNLRKAMEARR